MTSASLFREWDRIDGWSGYILSKICQSCVLHNLIRYDSSFAAHEWVSWSLRQYRECWPFA